MLRLLNLKRLAASAVRALLVIAPAQCIPAHEGTDRVDLPTWANVVTRSLQLETFLHHPSVRGLDKSWVLGVKQYQSVIEIWPIDVEDGGAPPRPAKASSYTEACNGKFCLAAWNGGEWGGGLWYSERPGSWTELAGENVSSTRSLAMLDRSDEIAALVMIRGSHLNREGWVVSCSRLKACVWVRPEREVVAIGTALDDGDPPAVFGRELSLGRVSRNGRTMMACTTRWNEKSAMLGGPVLVWTKAQEYLVLFHRGLAIATCRDGVVENERWYRLRPVSATKRL